QGSGRRVVRLVGIAPSGVANDAALELAADGSSATVALTVVEPALLRGDNGILWAHRDAARLSHEVSNNETLPRSGSWSVVSSDVDNLRAEVWDPGASGVGSVRIEVLGTPASIGIATGRARGALGNVSLERPV